jgi:hypothetical protein
MSVVGTAEILVVANDAGLAEEIQGADLSGLTAAGEAAGNDAGVALRDGVKEGSAGLAGDLADLGAVGGANLSGGIKDGAEDAEGGLNDLRDSSALAKDGIKDLGTESKNSSGLLYGLSSVLGGLGGPMGEAGEGAARASEGLGKMVENIPGLSMLAPLLSNPFADAAIAVGALGAVAIKFGADFQKTTNQIAANEGITKAAAAGIGDAFLSTAGSSIESGNDIAKAFAGVAGQAKEINGGALNAKQSLDLMTASMNDADATGGSLDGITQTLTTTLQAFGLGISSSPLVSDVLYTAANKTGNSIESVGNTIDKIKAKLGDLAPPLNQIGGLFIDLGEHGETGRAAMTALSTTFTTFLKPATDMATAERELKVATDNLPPSLKALADREASGTMTTAQVTAANKDLTTAQLASVDAYTKATTAVNTAGQAVEQMGVQTVNAQGQLLPLATIIGELHKQTEGMKTSMVISTLTADGFGTSAAKLAGVVMSGTTAFNAATDAAGKSGTAQNAAAVATSGLGDQWKKFLVSGEDGFTLIGQKLLPVVTDLASILLNTLTVVVKIVIDIFKDWIAISKDVIDSFEDLVDFVKDVFTGKWGAAWDAIKNLFGNAVHAILTSVMAVPDAIISALGNIGSRIADVFSNALNSVVGFFTALPGEIASALGSVVSTIWAPFGAAAGWINTNVIQPAIKLFSALPGQIVNALGAIVTTIWSGLTGAGQWVSTNVIAPVVGFFTKLPGQIVAGLGDIVHTIWAGLTTAASWVNTNVIQPVVAFFKGIPGDIGSLGSDILHTVFDFASTIGSWIDTNIIEPIVNAFKSIPGKIGSLGGSILHDITGGLGSAITTAVEPWKWGSGGLVTKPTFGVVGDTGPELVLNPEQTALVLAGGSVGNPLTKTTIGTLAPSSSSGGSQQYSINVSPGAVVITVPPGTPATESTMNDAINSGFDALTKELLAGTAPMRSVS